MKPCLLALLLLLASAGIAAACPCDQLTADRAFGRSKYVGVFKMRSVIKAEEQEKRYALGIKYVTMTVEKVFKGDLRVGQELTFHNAFPGNCSWIFRERDIGTDYLYYLDESRDGIFTAAMCTRSLPLQYRAADLRYLEHIGQVLGMTRISGYLKQELRPAVEGEKYERVPLGGKKVRIIGNGRDATVITDASGVYEIYGMPPGKYRIEPEKISGYSLDDFSGGPHDFVMVNLPDQGHVEKDLEFDIDNTVRGRLTDAAGKPLGDVLISMVPASGIPPKRGERPWERTRTDGTFEIKRIPAGKYVLAVNQHGQMTAEMQVQPFYYPASFRREAAKVLTVGPGFVLDKVQLKATQKVTGPAINGTLLFADGTPAGDQYVGFRPDIPGAGPRLFTTTAKDGTFRLPLIQGQKGMIYIKMHAFYQSLDNCPEMKKFFYLEDFSNSYKTFERRLMKFEALRDWGGVEFRFPFSPCVTMAPAGPEPSEMAWESTNSMAARGLVKVRF